MNDVEDAIKYLQDKHHHPLKFTSQNRLNLTIKRYFSINMHIIIIIVIVIVQFIYIYIYT